MSNESLLAARNLHRAVGVFLSKEVPLLPTDCSREQFWRMMLESVQKNMLVHDERESRSVSTSYDDAMYLVQEIRDLVPDVCEAGEDFAASVEEKADAIAESVARHRAATEGQLTALENMLDGLRRWVHD